MGEGPDPKTRLFGVFDAIPFVNRVGDPVVFTILAVFGGVVLLATALAGEIFPNAEDPRGDVLRIATGLLVLAGLYFGAVNLRTSRAQNYADRLSKTLDQLGSDNVAVRIGALHILEGLVLEDPEVPGDPSSRTALIARKRAVLEVLREVARGSDVTTAKVAQRILDDLARGGESQA